MTPSRGALWWSTANVHEIERTQGELSEGELQAVDGGGCVLLRVAARAWLPFGRSRKQQAPFGLGDRPAQRPCGYRWPMAETIMDEEWELLASFLPAEWRDLARETGAMRRARGETTSPEVHLQILLMHVATGLSLKQAAARARVQGLASVSDVALLKRLRTSEAWLGELARRMIEASRFSRAGVRVPEGHRLRAVDATTVAEPGATGTDWRIHYSLSLPEMRCDFYGREQ